MDEATAETFQRLTNIAATGDFQEFRAVARESYSTAESFMEAHKVFDRARRLTDRYADLQSTRDYLDGLASLDEPKLGGQAEMLKTQVSFSALWAGDESKVPSILEQFRRFRDHYSLAYRKAHRAYHEARETIAKSLAGLDDQLTVIERLDELELGGRSRGAACGRGPGPRGSSPPMRPERRAPQPFDDARCPTCRWDGRTKPPEADAEALGKRVDELAEDLRKRVAQEAIRKILESSGDFEHPDAARYDHSRSHLGASPSSDARDGEPRARNPGLG